MKCGGCFDSVKWSANVKMAKKFTDLAVESINGNLTHQVSGSYAQVYPIRH